MNIHFPKEQVHDFGMNAIVFPIECDSIQYRGAVSTDALQDHFGADNAHSHALVDAFMANRACIEMKITERFSVKQPDDILLRTSDFST